jgi:hypothetical protein
MEEREQERRQSRLASASVDPEKVRQVESLRLDKTEMERQLEATAHETRRQQLVHAIAEVEKRLTALAK